MHPAHSPADPLHTGRLILTPLDPHHAPDRELVIAGLCQAEFLGQPIAPESVLAAADERAFTTGIGFLSLLTFAGCAVQLPDAATTESGRFSHIRLPAVSAHPRLQIGRNTRAPRCAGCRTPLSDWRERMAHWAVHPHSGVLCPACGETRPPWSWDWKQHGGFGRLFVQIEEVFPGEAVPTSLFFEQLIRVTGIGWRHFYIQE